MLALAEIATSNLAQEDLGIEIQHWRGREIAVEADPPQAVAIGGDVIGPTPITSRVIPGAVRIVVPDHEARGASPDHLPPPWLASLPNVG